LRGYGCAKFFKLKPNVGSHHLKHDCMGTEEKENRFKIYEMNMVVLVMMKKYLLI
jgi:hypothetical protein